MAAFCRVALIWHDTNTPLSGARRVVIHFTCKIALKTLTLFGFFGWQTQIDYKWDDPNVDYSEYLGPEWRKELKEY